MRFGNLIRNLSLVAAFCVPTSALAGAFTPTALQGDFFFDDTTVGAMNCANVQVEGDVHQANGTVTGVGNDDDTVMISYSTPFTDKLRLASNRGQLGERTEAEIIVDVQPGAGSPTAAYNGTANPVKGKVDAKVADGTDAKVRAKFALGADFADLTPAPDADQLATIEAAFVGRKDVAVSGKKGVRVRHRGQTAVSGTCP